MDGNRKSSGQCLLCLLNIHEEQEAKSLKNKTEKDVVKLCELIQRPTFKTSLNHQNIIHGHDGEICVFCHECISIIDKTTEIQEQIVQLEAKLRTQIELIRNKILDSDNGICDNDELRSIRKSLLRISADEDTNTFLLNDEVEQVTVKLEPSIEDDDEEEYHDEDIDNDEPMVDPLENDEERSCSPSEFLIFPDHQETNFKIENQEDVDYMDDNDVYSDLSSETKTDKNVKKNKKRTATTLRRSTRIFLQPELNIKKEESTKSSTAVKVEGRPRRNQVTLQYCDTKKSRKKDLKAEKSELLDDSLTTLKNDSEPDIDDNSTFKCPTCNKSFVSEELLDYHIGRHHPHMCRACDKRFRTFDLKRRHEKSEHDGMKLVGRFSCSICSKTFSRQGLLDCHMYMKHETKVKNLSCSKCDKKFTLEYNLKRHLKLHNVEDKKPIICSVCDSRYEDQSRLELHAETHKGHSCNFCDKIFTSKIGMERHLRFHTGLRPFQCDHCELTFIDSNAKLWHIEKVHVTVKDGEEEKTCPICEKKFASDFIFRLHYKRHTDVKKVKTCDECGEEFKCNSGLRTHKIKKHGAEGFICDECGEQLMTTKGLEKHKMSHAGIKPHKCDVCDARFLNKNSLKGHMASHSDERPYICDHCGKRFKYPKNLTTHVKHIHLLDYIKPTNHVCSYCSKAFTQRVFMEAHVRQIHTLERPFVCSISTCNKGFAIKRSLTLHMKTHGIIKPTKQRLPRSKRDESLPLSHSSASSTKPTKKEIANKKPRRKVSDRDEEEYSLSSDSTTLSTNQHASDLNTNVPYSNMTQTTSNNNNNNNFPVSSTLFYSPSLSQYYQF